MRVNPQFGMGQVYLDANAEAVRRGDRRVGTDHVVLALLADRDSVTARALGVDLDTAREALERLDREALASVGMTAADPGPVFPGRVGDRLPLTPAAKAVFTGLRKEAGRERIGTGHVLTALMSRTHPDPAAALFDALGVDRTVVRTRLGKG
ncbi:Clp protease N-terminal domain-containing protein [Polymorphospora rubra]|uniref:Clp protease N-terminal domain-containing protein n=1 Tax=Polymorphospora rubra TaxID=338584 RepID=UPI0031CDCB96